jgi:hypothetical protein
MIKSQKIEGIEMIVLEVKEVKEPIDLYIPLLPPTPMKLLYLIWSNIRYEGEYLYVAPLREVAQHLNISETNIHRTIREAGRKLLNIRIEQTNRKGFIIGGLLSAIKIQEGMLYVKTLPEIQEIIRTFKSHYDKYDLRNFLNLETKYEIMLYKFLRHHLNLKKYYKATPIKQQLYKVHLIETTKEALYSHLQIPNSYKFKHIKERILDKAFRSFGSRVDLTFNYSIERGGRGNKKIKKITLVVADLTDQDNLITYIRATVPGNFIYIPGIGWKQIHTISNKGIQIDNGILEVDIWRWREILNETRARIGELEQLEKAREERIRLAQERLSQIGRRIKEK